MAVQLANVAAGLEVERFGVQPVSLDEILVYLFEHRRETAGKLRALSRLRPELETLKRAGKRVAFTNGCFDILHAGHVSYLRSAAGQGDVLVLGVNSDESIRRIKGPDRPVNREADRLMVLSELQSVDYLVLFDEDTPMTLLDELRPDVLVKGADYSREQVVGGDFVESCGGEVAIVDLVDGLSTTGIIGRIRGR
jgi:D-beta-D-heptose 7-phosphate kinase/D-beta-D-heptose 1-phosphate adenosyltransferase